MEKLNKQSWILGTAILFLIIVIPVIIFLPKSKSDSQDPWDSINKKRTHLDHSAFFKDTKFKTGPEVTAKCLTCHKDAAKSMMKTAHWNWLGDEVKIPGRDLTTRLGKKNVLNNFCIAIEGNEHGCTKCHAGYGWTAGEKFDFTKEENVDCLICHDWSQGYAKGLAGLPKKGIDLVACAKSVGYPKRNNCGTCHIYGGGGMGVKHGDIDISLINPSRSVDVHMSKETGLLCVDCHAGENHKILGKSYAVSVKADKDSINCGKCHTNIETNNPKANIHIHKDERINKHLDAVACQTCHIPEYSKQKPTKMTWDWSKAGDSKRKEDHFTYLKIKGEFTYDQNLTPEYLWFDDSVTRYLSGDKINPDKITDMNPPRGDISSKKAKIWPFKVHKAIQPYDKEYKYLLQPTTKGDGGFWHEFNWDKAFRLGEKNTGLKYSGKYGWAKTTMHWPLSHMVSPAKDALSCESCHSKNSRMNWKALGYGGDPAIVGSRKTQKLLKEQKGE